MAESDDFAYEWDESKRRNTRKSRGIDFADMVLFDWDTALTSYVQKILVSKGPSEI